MRAVSALRVGSNFRDRYDDYFRVFRVFVFYRRPFKNAAIQGGVAIGIPIAARCFLSRVDISYAERVICDVVDRRSKLYLAVGSAALGDERMMFAWVAFERSNVAA